MLHAENLGTAWGRGYTNIASRLTSRTLTFSINSPSCALISPTLLSNSLTDVDVSFKAFSVRSRDCDWLSSDAECSLSNSSCFCRAAVMASGSSASSTFCTRVSMCAHVCVQKLSRYDSKVTNLENVQEIHVYTIKPVVSISMC